jgi:hypothetical protein
MAHIKMATGKKKNIADAGYSSAITYQPLSTISAAALHISMPPKNEAGKLFFFLKQEKKKKNSLQTT